MTSIFGFPESPGRMTMIENLFISGMADNTSATAPPEMGQYYAILRL
ncbi:hypothetical protein CWATWH0401_2235 [Crocosphaera watsonii WH 0401]|uniref:Uncharacterized protein n=1 Tax=Crocosphaera watsonii WH 0401 TaxID=555881 RepID=T2JGC3_CROWT|nr:hypothetical protein CWATWH0401_2235 [Crocosphaera watsonii WH 0401]